MRAVAEGVTTAGAAVALGKRHGVEMPIAAHVYAILQGQVHPRDAVTALMTRALKREDA
jgi:glycerol-3-phosphate dehydrogenase (NAD(P)+)